MSTFLSIYLHLYRSIHIYLYLYLYLYVYLFIDLSTYLSIYIFIYICVCVYYIPYRRLGRHMVQYPTPRPAGSSAVDRGLHLSHDLSIYTDGFKGALCA